MPPVSVLEWRDAHAMGVKKVRGVVQRDDKGLALGPGPWWDFDGPPGGRGFDAMGVKTCFLRAKRWAPMGISVDLDRAAAVDGGVRLTHNADDPDEMFDVPHPKPGDVIEGEMVGEGDDEPAAAPERERVSVQHRPDPAPEAAAEAPADPRDEPAASQGQHRKIMALLGKHLVKGKHTDAHRHAVFSAILGEQITTGKQLSAAGADRIYEQLQA